MPSRTSSFPSSHLDLPPTCRFCKLPKERVKAGKRMAWCCKPCRAGLQTQYRLDPDARERARVHEKAFRDRRRQLLNEYKLARGCADCGYQAHPAALEFDHVPERGRKLFCISENMAKRPWAEVMAEVAKCDVVCANCHRIRTAERQEAVA